MANILVVDDELGIRDLLSEILFDEGHQVELAENAAMAREVRLRMRPDLVLLDIWMPDTDGVSLLKEWATAGLLNMPVIMMSGHATIDTAVDAVKIGAQAFLEKPHHLAKVAQGGGAGPCSRSGQTSNELGRCHASKRCFVVCLAQRQCHQRGARGSAKLSPGSAFARGA